MFYFLRSLPVTSLLFCSFILSSCDSPHETGSETLKKNVDSITNPKTSPTTIIINSDTAEINIKSAVFVYPDSTQIIKLKKKIGEENFQIGADDEAYYMNVAYEFLDSMHLTMLDIRGKKYLKFIGTKNTEIINLQKLELPWNIYLFDPAKKVKEADMMNMEQEYQSYFR